MLPPSTDSGSPRWAERYVGIPYADNADTLSAASCWGLCRLVLRERAGLADLPVYWSENLLDVARHFQAARQEAPPWRIPDRPPQALDCVLMTSMTGSRAQYRVIGHVGIMVSSTHLLHVWRETDSVIMPLTHPRVAPKIVQHMRHIQLPP